MSLSIVPTMADLQHVWMDGERERETGGAAVAAGSAKLCSPELGLLEDGGRYMTTLYVLDLTACGSI